MPAVCDATPGSTEGTVSAGRMSAGGSASSRRRPDGALHDRVQQQPEAHHFAVAVVADGPSARRVVGLELLDALAQATLLRVGLPRGGHGLSPSGLCRGNSLRRAGRRCSLSSTRIWPRAAPQLRVVCFSWSIWPLSLSRTAFVSPRAWLRSAASFSIVASSSRPPEVVLGAGPTARPRGLPPVGADEERERRRIREACRRQVARLEARRQIGAARDRTWVARCSRNSGSFSTAWTIWDADELGPLRRREGAPTCAAAAGTCVAGIRPRALRAAMDTIRARSAPGRLVDPPGRGRSWRAAAPGVAPTSTRRHAHTTGTSTGRRAARARGVSSTAASPARSRCQNSRFVVVRTTSNRVRFPHAPQRHRRCSSGSPAVGEVDVTTPSCPSAMPAPSWCVSRFVFIPG